MELDFDVLKNVDSIFPGGEAPLALRSEIETWQLAEDQIHSANRLETAGEQSERNGVTVLSGNHANP